MKIRDQFLAVAHLVLLVTVASASGQQAVWDKPIEFTIQEEISVGSFVGDLPSKAGLNSMYDKNVLSQMVFQFAEVGDADISAYVDIDASGILRTRRRIDREELCAMRVTCHLRGDVAIIRPAELFQIIPVRLVLTDINDNSPAFPSPEATISLPETAGSAGDLIHSAYVAGVFARIPLATDPDSPEFGVVSYRLLSGREQFDLQFQRPAPSASASLSSSDEQPAPVDIRLVPKMKLDRESVSLYEVSVAAYDGGKPARSAVLTLTVVVEDINDNGPMFEQDVYNVSVGEDLAVNVTFLTISATDADSGANGLVRYEWDGGDATSQYRQGVFGLNPLTGGMFVQQPLDYETKHTYRLVALAVDGGSPARTSTAIVHVTVRDVNDSPPRITINSFRPNKTALVQENSAIGEFVAYVSVTDPDGGPAGVANCVLGSGQHSDKFALTTTKNGQYRIVTEATLDREKVAEYTLTVRCVDLGSPPLTSTSSVVVIVGDVNDNKPQFLAGHYRMAVSLPENSPVGSLIGNFSASDADAGVNAKMTYSLVEELARKYLSIDELTGAVRTRAAIDFEKLQSLVFTVQAADGGQPPLTANQSVLLRVVDRNDEPPLFQRPLYTFHVAENRPSGSFVGDVYALDNDSPPNNIVMYYLDPGTPVTFPFTIGENDGKVYASRPLDREVYASYRFNVIARDKAIATLTDVTQVHVIVDDVNDHAPVVFYPPNANESVRVSNRAPIGYRVSRVQAADVDEGLNGNLTFALLETGNIEPTAFRPFAVLSTSGDVVVSADLSGIHYATYSMLIHVSDRGTPAQSTVTVLTVIVDAAAPYYALGSESGGEGGRGGGSSGLLAGSSLTVVAIVSIASLILVACLLVAVVMARSMTARRRRQRWHQKAAASASASTSAVGSRGLARSAPELQRHQATAEQMDLLRSAENVYCQNDDASQKLRSNRVATGHVMNLPYYHNHAGSNGALTINPSVQYANGIHSQNGANRSYTMLSSSSGSSANHSNSNVPSHILRLEAHLMALLAGHDLPATRDDDNHSAGEASTSADSGRGASISLTAAGGVAVLQPGSRSSNGDEQLMQEAGVVKDSSYNYGCFGDSNERLHASEQLAYQHHHISPRSLRTFTACSPQLV